MSDAEDLVDRLVARCIELMDTGQGDPVAEVCVDHPELVPVVLARLEGLRGLGILASSRGDDRPERIGPYRILDELGRGGMGTVYLAEQEVPVRRRVALKVVKSGMDTREVLARFEAERQALARMNHPHIASIFDAGSTEQGRPFFVMEYVEGLPITDYCDRRSCSTEARLELFLAVCEAVQHAHRRGILHRDLKPSNVLVAEVDGRHVPKVIDFGVSKAADDSGLAGDRHTEVGRLLGTPEYMSPEQAGRGASDVDTRTDVYSLGVVLYELLTGELPFDSKRLRAANPAELQRIIGEEEPARPSTRVSEHRSRRPQPRGLSRRSRDDQKGPPAMMFLEAGPNPAGLGTHGGTAAEAARARGTEIGALIRRLRGDLDWITMKALEKDRERRYGSAAELAADVRRHLAHDIVQARPTSAVYRLRRLARRYRVQVVAASVVLFALVAGIVTSTAFYFETDRERVRAQQHLDHFNLLANVVRLAEARDRRRELFPSWNAGALEAWLAEHGAPLEREVPVIETALAELSSRATGNGATGESRFDLKHDQFLYDTLHTLIDELRAFTTPETGDVAHVRREIAWASVVGARSVDAHRAEWDAAIAAIAASDGVRASEAYRGFTLTPQVGLVPIGMDPRSKLWEFAHLRSAVGHGVSVRDAATGVIPVDGDSGIVFVLVPGGRFWMGGQRLDPDGHNYDPHAKELEAPVHEVELDVFFLAKHEMSQGQWSRLADGANPSTYPAGVVLRGTETVTWAHPVEQVSWNVATEVLRRHGLALPTEAQWERGCRAGTGTVWSTGNDPQSLAGHVNLADRTRGIAHGAMGTEQWLEDGFIVHAPIGSFAPNPFGLHDMHGNIWEWCRDARATYEVSPRAGDGLREPGPGEPVEFRMNRGGSFTFGAGSARSSNRFYASPAIESSYLGVRAARPVLPPGESR